MPMIEEEPKTAKPQKSFVIYHNWSLMISQLPEMQAGKLIKAVCCKKEGVNYDVDDPTVKAILLPIFEQLDIDAAKYAEIVAKRAEAGKRSAAERRRVNNKSAERTRRTSKTAKSANVNHNTTNAAAVSANAAFASTNDNAAAEISSSNTSFAADTTAVNDIKAVISPLASENKKMPVNTDSAVLSEASEASNVTSESSARSASVDMCSVNGNKRQQMFPDNENDTDTDIDNENVNDIGTENDIENENHKLTDSNVLHGMTSFSTSNTHTHMHVGDVREPAADESITPIAKEEQTTSTVTDAKADGTAKTSPAVKGKISTKTLEAEFESIWKLYPRKLGKSNALKSYIRDRKKGVTYDQIMQGVLSYRDYVTRDGVADEYIKYGSTFFQQQAWQDDYGTHFNGSGSNRHVSNDINDMPPTEYALQMWRQAKEAEETEANGMNGDMAQGAW